MRTLIVTEFVTLDGVMEAPGGEPTHPHAGWMMAYGTPELFAFKMDEIREAESLLLGRVTYEGFSAAWPGRAGDEFADKMNVMPKHVVTSTLPDLGWNSTPITGDIAAAVRDIKEEDGGPILVEGSAMLVHLLLAQGLVDELRLQVFPVVIGGGTRVFPDDRNKIAFSLAELVQYDSGASLQIYRTVAG